MPDKFVRGQFRTQIMTFHPDHKDFLTNKDDNGIKNYDLKSKSVRKTFDRLHFICKIGDLRYSICQDLPGLCRRTLDCEKWKKKKYFWSKKKCETYKVDVIGTDEHDFLVKSGVHCFSELSYPNGIY